MLTHAKCTEETADGTIHHFSDAGKFNFRSGVVCWDSERERITVHINRETGQVSLPQAPCEWILQENGVNIVEGFSVTADRISTHELGYGATSTHPIVCPCSFLLHTAILPSGLTKVTAWYLTCPGSEDYGFSGYKDGTLGRGEDWVVDDMTIKQCMKKLCAYEVQILEKAIEAREDRDECL